jgi:hypothetical protein
MVNRGDGEGGFARVAMIGCSNNNNNNNTTTRQAIVGQCNHSDWHIVGGCNDFIGQHVVDLHHLGVVCDEANGEAVGTRSLSQRSLATVGVSIRLVDFDHNVCLFHCQCYCIGKFVCVMVVPMFVSRLIVWYLACTNIFNYKETCR